MKLGPIIAGVVVVAALGFGAVAFKNSLVAYMPFAQAIAAAPSGSTVQIMGAPVSGKTSFDATTGDLDFDLRESETGQVMPVIFKSPKPDNFDEAVKIAAIGKYDPRRQVFEADNLLVKCPSKYAGSPGATTDRSYSAQSS